eukprot:Rmarinus@m.25968
MTCHRCLRWVMRLRVVTLFAATVPNVYCITLTERGDDAQANVTASDPVDQNKKPNVKHTNPFLHLAAGGVAGAISRTAVAPLERVKITMQVQHVKAGPPKYTGVFQGIFRMYREDGVRGLFIGNGINVLRIAPFTAVQFLSYDRYKKWMFGSSTELTPAQRLFAGGCAGMTAAMFTYPLDMMRARVTIGDSDSIWRGMRYVMRTEGGFLALYRGLWPTLVGVFPYIGIDFAVYDTLKPYMPREPPEYPGGPPGKVTTVGLLLCGATAGVVAQTCAYPIDLVRRRMQVQRATDPHRYHGIWHGLRSTVKREGFKGLYHGLLSNTLKAVPAIAISFAVYERAKEGLSSTGIIKD